MSANNAVFVTPVLWVTPKLIINGRVTEWATIKKWLVFHGDVDMHGETTHTGKLTQRFLWYALLEGAHVYTNVVQATKAADLLASQINPLEYGTIMSEPLLYEEPL